MDLVEKIGPVLGILAFVGLAGLAFLLFQQARDIRRLREWAGRAPERAEEASEAVQAAAEARGEARAEAEVAAPEGPEGQGRLGAAWSRITGGVARRFRAVDRRLPIDGRYVLAAAGIALIAAAALTSGFGLVGDGDDGAAGQRRGGGPKPAVAILNGTGVPGLAARVDEDVIQPAGYESGAVTNTAAPDQESSIVAYSGGRDGDAKALATAIQSKLGRTPTEAMTPDIESRAAGAPLALVIGLDDASFGTGQ
jgi:hypothetical protein